MQTPTRLVRRLVSLLAIVSFAAVAPAMAQQTTATGEPKVLSGTITINSTQLAFIVSGQMGGGVLTYKGKEHAFDIGGLGVGGVGVQKLSAKGQVSNLTDLSKFPGTYGQARAGATVGTGKGALSLSNEHGVILELASTSEGVALSIGVDGMSVKLKN